MKIEKEPTFEEFGEKHKALLDRENKILALRKHLRIEYVKAGQAADAAYAEYEKLRAKKNEIEKQLNSATIFQEMQPVTVIFPSGYKFLGFITELSEYRLSIGQMVYYVLEADKSGERPKPKTDGSWIKESMIEIRHLPEWEK